MTNSGSGSRVYFLGAGFSCAAGLPAASDLYPLVRQAIESRHGTDTKFDQDVERYLSYSEACGKAGQTKADLNLEQLMSYLDIEHFLGLRGADTRSAEGNEGQLMIRHAIGEVITGRTPEPHKLPDCYYRFADRLTADDLVFSFNYDLVLEAALQHCGKRYRRYPVRRVASATQVPPIADDEIVLSKLHGSVDWFDKRHFSNQVALVGDAKETGRPVHAVFDDPKRFEAKRLVPEVPEGDSSGCIHEISKVREFYEQKSGFVDAPLLLSLSYVKIVYAQPLLHLWRGLGRIGRFNAGVSIIGFSLPDHDEYIRVPLHALLRIYSSWWDDVALQGPRDYVRFVDLKTDSQGRDDYQKRYGFVDSARTKFFFDGFGERAVEFLFNEPRT